MAPLARPSGVGRGHRTLPGPAREPQGRPRVTVGMTHRTPILLLVVLMLAGAPRAGAQTAAAADSTRPAAVMPQAAPAVVALAEDLRAAQQSHLWRVGLWGTANLALGIGLLAAGGRDAHPTRFGFGIQAAAWGAINMGIAGWGLFLADPGPLPTTLGAALRAENGYSDLLLVNLGLNVGYMGVGAALAVASGRGLRSGDAVRGHALAVILQGAGLFALDGVAWLGSRTRLDALVSFTETAQIGLAPGAVPGAVAMTIGLPIG